jgi:hypothetical protein
MVVLNCGNARSRPVLPLAVKPDVPAADYPDNKQLVDKDGNRSLHRALPCSAGHRAPGRPVRGADCAGARGVLQLGTPDGRPTTGGRHGGWLSCEPLEHLEDVQRNADGMTTQIAYRRFDQAHRLLANVDPDDRFWDRRRPSWVPGGAMKKTVSSEASRADAGVGYRRTAQMDLAR